MKKLLLLITFFYISNINACVVFDGQKYHTSPISLQNLNIGKDLCLRWHEGKVFSEQIFEEALKVGLQGRESDFQDKNYNFFEYQEMNLQDINLPPELQSNPVGLLQQQINDFQRIVQPNLFKSDDLKAEFAKIGIGLYKNLEKSKYIVLGRELEIKGLQNFLFDRILEHVLFAPNDKDFSSAVLLYLQARHFEFPKNYVFMAADEIRKFAFRNYKPFDLKAKKNIVVDETKYRSISIISANMFSFCEIKGTDEKYNFFYGGLHLNDWCIRNAVNISNELGLRPMELKMRQRYSKYLKNSDPFEERTNNSVRILELASENKLLKTWTDKFSQKLLIAYYRISNYLIEVILILFVSMTLIGIIKNMPSGKVSISNILAGMTHFFKKIFGISTKSLSLYEKFYLFILPILISLIIKSADFFSSGIYKSL